MSDELSEDWVAIDEWADRWAPDAVDAARRAYRWYYQQFAPLPERCRSVADDTEPSTRCIREDGHRDRHEDRHGTRWVEIIGWLGKPVFHRIEPPPPRGVVW